MATIRNNLPVQPTPFVGRSRELQRLAHLLGDPDVRLVTILAPGGMGKTRLALEAARQQLDDFHDGVFYVPLAPLTSPDDIVTTIAEYVGFSFYSTEAPKQQLLDYFRQRYSLVLLDNCEHLLNDVSLLSEIIQAAPHVKVLATSREKIHLSAETIFSLGGMSFPRQETLVDTLDYDAVRLFIQSARRVRPDFDLRPDDLKQVINICCLMEGMPLGIVLATGWLDTLGLGQIAAELQQGIDILETELRDVPERQRSVRATLNYSWERLAEAERDVLMKLSVFRGGFTPEAAGFVAGAEMKSLRKLANKALIQVDANGRYTIHELLRQYGEEKLNEAGQADCLCQMHCDYFANLMRQREADVKGRRQLEALNEIEADFNNIRTAWEWAATSRHVGSLDAMLETLHLFCDLRVRYQEGTVLFEQAVRAMTPMSGEAPQPVWYHLQARQAAIWLLPVERLEEAHSQLQVCQQAAQLRADQAELAYCTFQLAEVEQHTAAYQNAVQLYGESRALFHAIGDPYYVGRTLRGLAYAYSYRGHDYLELWGRLSQELIELTREIGDRTGMAHGIFYLAMDHWDHANYVEAVPLLGEAQHIWWEMGDKKDAAIAVGALSFYWFAKGDFERVTALAEELLAIGEEVAYPGIRSTGLAMFSRVAAMREDYVTARALAQTIRDHIDMWCGPWEMAVAELGQKNFRAARDFLCEALQRALRVRQVPSLLIVLPLAAAIAAHDNHHERAVELLGLAVTEPRSLTGWMEKWPLLNRLRDELEVELGMEAYAAAWKRGATLDLESVCHALLSELQATDSPMPSNQRHPDALTPREQDVLYLMVYGHSNREIAEALVLSVGTVKGYVYNVCQKLGVQNRTHAVARAREQNLI